MSSTLDRIALLERLQALRDQEAISHEEFFEQKAALLGRNAPPLTRNSYEWEREDESMSPRRFNVGQTNGARVVAFVLILLVGFVGYYIWSEKSAAALETASQTYVTMSNGNIRSVAATSGNIVGTLGKGEHVSGKMEATDKGEQWLKLDGGDFVGSYVWAGNLKSQGQQAGSMPEVAEGSPTSATRNAEASPASVPSKSTTFSQHYLVGAWVQEPGKCFGPDQTVIGRDGMTEDGMAGHRVTSPTRMFIGVDEESEFAISDVTPNSFTSRILDPTTPANERTWRWKRCR